MTKILSLIVIVFLLGCNQSSEKDEPQTTLDSLLNQMGEPITADTTNNLTDSTEKLHNFWVLETIDDVALNTTEFTGGSPYFNLDLEKSTVSGYGGCNGLNGTLKVQGDKIFFGKINASKTACSNIKFEKEYLNNLSGRSVTYELSPGKLKLRTKNGSVYGYRKIRQ